MVDDPVNSWDILWNEKYSGQILMYNSIRDTIGITLMKLGYSINTRNEADIAAAEEALIEQKPLVQAYLGDEIKDRMIGGGAALAVAGLAAEGVTTVQGIGHIQRGYADLAGDLRALGARITEQ